MTAISTAVPADFVARVVGVKTAYKNLREGVVLLPQRIGLIGQGATLSTYSLDKKQFLNAVEVGVLSISPPGNFFPPIMTASALYR